MFPPNSNGARQSNSLIDDVLVSPPINDDDAVSDWSLLGGVPLTPGASDWSLVSGTHAEIPLTDIDLNNDAYAFGNLRCAFCPPNRKKFHNVAVFQAHIASAAHAPKFFHCPLVFVPDISLSDLRKKKKHFSTLSGLTQHLESGACRGGVATFEKAIRYVEEQLKVLGFGGVRLLLD